MNELTAPGLLDHRADGAGGRPFIRVGDVQHTYQEVRDRSLALANRLRQIGLVGGERVAYLAPTSIDEIELMFAVWRLGAINVPINIFLRGNALAHQLVDSDPAVVVADESGAAAMMECTRKISSLRRVVLAGSDPIMNQLHAADTAGVSPEPEPGMTTLRGSDIASILYTSGTTGPAKGCIVSSKYLRHMGSIQSGFVAGMKDPVIFTSSPLYHALSHVALMLALEVGGSVAIDPAFHASTYFERAADVGATLGFGIGWLATALLAQPPSPHDRSHRLEAILMGPASEPDCAAFEQRFGVAVHPQLYGQTECVSICWAAPGERGVPGSLGRPRDFVDVEVHDEDGLAVPDGSPGEIVLRPKRPGVMFEGYWRDPAATADAFRGVWYHTGDVARADSVGYLHFVDRKTDSIRRRGENVSAYEVESAIHAFPAIAAAAVHGVRVEGEVDDAIKACVVLRDCCELALEDFVRHLADELAYFAVPRFVEIFSDLPRSASGRISKRELRSLGLTASTIDLHTLGLAVGRSARRGPRLR